MRGPILGNIRGGGRVCNEWITAWLAGSTLETSMFGPNLGPPLLKNVGDVTSFVAGDEGKVAREEPWRAKIVYVATTAEGKYGPDTFIAASWKYKWLVRVPVFVAFSSVCTLPNVRHLQLSKLACRKG